MTQIRYSFVRADMQCTKKQVSDTGWKTDNIPPRYSVFDKTRPCGSGWEWRCITCKATNGTAYRLLFHVSPTRAKWKAHLLKVGPDGQARAIVRLEDQAGNNGGGLHVHVDCDEATQTVGALSIDMRYVFPDHGRRRRRRRSWTKPLFCQMAGQFFRTDMIVDQEEMEV